MSAELSPVSPKPAGPTPPRRLPAPSPAAAVRDTVTISANATPAFGEPSLSPDGSEIAFVSGGDIWTVPTAGGQARLLVAHPATESRPIFSPDGSRLAFTSDRTGAGNVYTLDLQSGDTKRLTFNDGKDQVEGWSRDGKWIYFSSTSQDMGGMNDIFRVSADGGTPMPVAADRFSNEYFSAAGPDNDTIALTGHGYGAGQWWRHGHSHLDESQIYLKQGTSYQQLTEPGAKDMWPMWSADNRSIYYVSDRSGAENIWERPLDGKPQQVTDFHDGRVLWPSISQDGKSIVFEREAKVWKMDLASGQAGEVPIARRGAPVGPATDHLTLNAGFRELALSPDGKKVAFIVRGEVFAASSEEGGQATQVSHTAAEESQVTWSPDSRRLVYVSDRDGSRHLYAYDFNTSSECQLTSGNDSSPTFSPDGGQIAFMRDGSQLCALDLQSKQERVLATGHFEQPPFNSARPIVWSPDGSSIAYMDLDNGEFKNMRVVPAAGGESQPLSFLANTNANTASWSADGSFVLFDTGQRTESGQLARVDLVRNQPTFAEDKFRGLFGEGSAPAPKAAARIDFDGLRQRCSLLPVGVDVSAHQLSPDSKSVLLTAVSAGQENLFILPLDADAPHQITATAGAKSGAQFSPDGKTVYYLDNGRIHSVAAEGGAAKPLNVTAEMDVDFDSEKMVVFRQAWSNLRDNFFDPAFNGVDWDGMRASFQPLVAGAKTPDEVRRLISLMIGELNASHLGISPPQAKPLTVGRLGLDFDREEYERDGKLRVRGVVANGPTAGSIQPGESLTAVNGVPITAATNLDQLLDHQIGHRVALTVDGREVLCKPVNTADERQLRYREWVEANRCYVEQKSGGRLGYVHMADMSSESLNQLYLDLDAQNQARDGVVVDIRNNNGGFVNAYAIDVLSRRDYLNFAPRDLPASPARRVLGQRTLGKPTILVTNQHSLSDAEDFTEGYRALKLGKVVGEPTAGWIVFTSNMPLVDGSQLRLPFDRVTTVDGQPMEMNPRPVDVPVSRPMGESYSGRDSQLDTAVKELLDQLGRR